MAEQNVLDSGYVAVHTGVNHKAFCKQKITAITMSCSPSEMTFITLFVQLVWGQYFVFTVRPSCLGG